jgi:hypothetical protein
MARLIELKEPVTIRQGVLTFRLDGNHSITGQSLRAAIARLYPHYPQLCQRTPSGELIYRHPHVQFKSMDGMGVITALGEEAQTLVEVFATLPELYLGGRRLKIVEKKLDVQDVWFGPTEKDYAYVFTSPWLALNQENIKLYTKLDQTGKRKFLERILTGNILSMAKGLGFFLVPDVMVTVSSRWSETPSFFKRIQMKGIRCRFRTNMLIPHLWGIGQKPSSGWGTTVPIMCGGDNVP